MTVFMPIPIPMPAFVLGLGYMAYGISGALKVWLQPPSSPPLISSPSIPPFHPHPAQSARAGAHSSEEHSLQC